MPEPSFLGIDKSHWDFVNSFANWLSAAGTLAAVVVSLWLAGNTSRPKAKLSAGVRLIVERGVDVAPEYLVLSVVNVGQTAFRVIWIGWRVRSPKKRFAMQLFDASLSSSLPANLEPNHEAYWFVPLAEGAKKWRSEFAGKMLMPHWCWTSRSLRFLARTSTGHVFVGRVDPELVSELRAECRSLSHANPEA